MGIGGRRGGGACSGGGHDGSRGRDVREEEALAREWLSDLVWDDGLRLPSDRRGSFVSSGYRLLE